GRELVVAGVERVVHVVVDRVRARRRARVEALRTTGCRVPLRGRVGDVVALVVATALERVQEAEPVAGLVRRGPAEREVRAVRTADERVVVEHDAVQLWAALVPGRERRKAE